MRVGKYIVVLLMIWGVLLSGGCAVSSEEQQARDVTTRFWQAILQDNMEEAKQLVTWDSAQYLQFVHSKQMSAKRFETGELKIENNGAEIATVLYGGDRGDMEIPLRTVLIRKDDAWLVDVQKTMGSMVSGAMGAVVNQLNSFMQDGLKGLDETLSNSIDQLGKNLEKGMQDLQKDLTPPPPRVQPEEKQI